MKSFSIEVGTESSVIQRDGDWVIYSPVVWTMSGTRPNRFGPSIVLQPGATGYGIGNRWVIKPPNESDGESPRQHSDSIQKQNPRPELVCVPVMQNGKVVGELKLRHEVASDLTVFLRHGFPVTVTGLMAPEGSLIEVGFHPNPVRPP